MATVIDSLIITLGLDSKDVDAKAPGVRKKLQDIEKEAGKAEKTTAGFSKEMKAAAAGLGSLLAVAGGTFAIRSFVRDVVDANTQLHFLSQNLGMTVQSLFSLGAAGQQIGIGKGALQGLAQTFREIPGQLEAGQQPAVIKLLARAGINWLGSPQQMMVGLSKWFSSMPANVALGLGTSYGLSYDQMTFLLQGAQKVAAELKQTGQFSPTKKETEQAAELKKQLVDFDLQWKKIGYDLLSFVTPAIEGFLQFLREIGAWAQRHEKIVAVIAGVAAALGAIGALAGIIGSVAAAWGVMMAGLGTAWPILAVVGTIAALAGAILLLWNDYKVWSEGGKSLFDWTGWVNSINAAKRGWDALRDSITGAWGALGKWYDKAAQAMGLDTSKNTQDKDEDAAIAAYNKAHPQHQIAVPAKGIRRTAHLIAYNEGFYATNNSGEQVGNIPQRAHNPGDIEWGDFARAHGATGYLTAKGGKKIATFADDDAGWNAAYALLSSKRYASLSPAQQMARWVNGIKGASSGANLASTHNSSTANTDNSHTTHIGTVNINSPSGTMPSTPGMARGMDWTTLLTQSNAGLQ